MFQCFKTVFLMHKTLFIFNIHLLVNYIREKLFFLILWCFLSSSVYHFRRYSCLFVVMVSSSYIYIFVHIHLCTHTYSTSSYVNIFVPKVHLRTHSTFSYAYIFVRIVHICMYISLYTYIFLRILHIRTYRKSYDSSIKHVIETHFN